MTDAWLVRDADPLGDGPECARIYAPYVSDSHFTFETTPPEGAEMSTRISIAQELFPWLVAERGGEVSGYAYAAPHNTRAAYAWACSTAVYVDAGARGAGCGRALYQQLLARIAELGYLTATAGITLPNDASIALHEQCGFRQVGRYDRIGFKLGTWYDVIWMQRDFVEDGADFPNPPSALRRPSPGGGDPAR